MATSRGGPAVRQFMAQAPGQIAEKVLRGAARAAANVIAEEARNRAEFEETKDAIAVASKLTATGVTATVSVKKGFGRSVGFWLEYGTSPHFISVDDSQRNGMSVNRINKKGTLAIGGQPVGTTVHHPGARPHPFLRVSLDVKGAEAITAAQGYINSRVGPSGITGSDEPEGEDA